MNMGGMNMNNLMKQAQKMQRQIEETKERMAEERYEVTSGGGAVKITITGEKIIEKITISPDVVDSDDIEMLEDLILTAVNEAVRTAAEAYEQAMSKVAGPGMPGGLF
jgi:DNA-binding YbaB/EbfC family protein